MTKASPARLQRRAIRKNAEKEAALIGPAEARRKLAEWAARGGDVEGLMKPRVVTERSRMFGPGGLFDGNCYHGVTIKGLRDASRE